MSNLLKALERATNLTTTENGATAYKSTGNAVYDFFAFGGALRNDPITALYYFKLAWYENAELAIKALFNLRDVRGGQGERDIFRLCFVWLLSDNKKVRHLISLIPTFGRWDDLIVILDAQEDRKFERDIYESLIYKQLISDMKSEHPSLLAKWLPSLNTSSNDTRRKALKVRAFLGLTNKEYRKMLSTLRKKINIVERLMSANKWDEINFEYVPSGANLKYKDCFLTRSETSNRYKEFISDDTKEIHSSTLYPYEIIHKMIHDRRDSVNDRALNKMWDNLPDYFNGSDRNILCVIDTSGSMDGYEASAPINTAIGLGIYAAQRSHGYFHNHFITFASRPNLVKLYNGSTAEQAREIRNMCLVDNTNLEAVFKLLLNTALANKLSQEDMPEAIVVISDMQIDQGTGDYWCSSNSWTAETAQTEMEKIRKEWEFVGFKLPHLVYWNVESRRPTILDGGKDVTFVSGLAPTHFKAICKGLTGIDLMLDTLLSERYASITLK